MDDILLRPTFFKSSVLTYILSKLSSRFSWSTIALFGSFWYTAILPVSEIIPAMFLELLNFLFLSLLMESAALPGLSASIVEFQVASRVSEPKFFLKSDNLVYFSSFFSFIFSAFSFSNYSTLDVIASIYEQNSLFFV